MAVCTFRSLTFIRSLTLVSLFALSSSSSATAAVIYVNAAAPAGGNGSSWATAYNSLDVALLVANAFDVVWVAEGTYKPSIPLSPDPRTVTFSVQKYLNLYGGFRGNETSLSRRAGLFSTTVLDGDVGIIGNSADNSYTVVSVTSRCRIDGFTIKNGNADGGPTGLLYEAGGGIHCVVDPSTGATPTLELFNCFIASNNALRGGGLYAEGCNRLLIKWCEFSYNTANAGAAIFARYVTVGGGTSVVFNTIFDSNSARSSGGAVWLDGIGGGTSDSLLTFINCAFQGNRAVNGGVAYLTGQPYSMSGKAKWINCTMAYNTASDSGGAVYANTSATYPAVSIFRNSIVWANHAPTNPQLAGSHTASYSDVDGGITGAGNINSDPLFGNGPARKLALGDGSPAIEAGCDFYLLADLLDVDGNGDVMEQVPLDCLGLPRVVDDSATSNSSGCSGSLVDMGAFEHP